MAFKNLDKKTINWLKTLIFLLALLPLAKLGYLAFNNDLGANPIEKITRTTGYWTLTFLMVGLAISPLRQLTGYQWLARLRRMLGLFVFFYGSLHFLCYAVLDQFFDWDGIVKDIVKRPYITVGFPAFLLLIPLAITSTDAMMRKLGGKGWKALHKLVYLCAIGGVIHYWWLVKKDLSNPIAFAVVLAILLGYRLIRYLIHSRKRQKLSGSLSPLAHK
jgi:methionine sulfoxide reductase heme-binding subunit